MKQLFFAALVSLSLAACASKEEKPVETPPAPTPAVVVPQKAQAILKAGKGSKAKGVVHFSEDNGRMTIEILADGFKSGPHGIHIHEVGDCSSPDFSSAGGHFNPTQMKHGAPNTTPHHLGDLGNVTVNKKGKLMTTIAADGLTMKPGSDSIIGKSIVIHAGKDDLKSQPAGNSGARVACGVIEAL